MRSWQKSYRMPRGERLLSLQVRMKHSHPDGAKPEEVFAYAKAKLMGGPRLVSISKQGGNWAVYTRGSKPVRAELCFTRDTGRWQDRKWETVAATIDEKARRVSGVVPDGAAVYYLNLVDAAGLIVSSEHVELK